MAIYQREIDILVLELTGYVADQALREKYDNDLSKVSRANEGAEDSFIRIRLKELHDALSSAPTANSNPNVRMQLYADALNSLQYDRTFTPNDVRSLLNKGLRAFAQTHPDQTGFNRVAHQILTKQNAENRLMYDLRYGGKGSKKSTKVGGQQESKQGGKIEETRENTHYIPTGLPRVSHIKKMDAVPCMFETKVTTGDRGYWDWNCKRAALPGVKQCELRRVEDKRTSIVPMQCLGDYVNVVRSLDVEKVTETDTETGQKVVREIVTPEIERYNSPISVKKSGPAIPFEMLKRVDGTERVTPLMKTDAYNRGLIDRQLGGTNAKDGGSDPASAGAVHLPTKSAVRKHEFTLTDQDLDDIQSPIPKGLMKQPESWAELPSLDDQGKIAFYTMDEYGSVRNYALENGFNFNFKHLPFSHAEQQSYLEYLVSLDYKMRAQFPETHRHVFDPVYSTIATVESNILATLGKLEASGKFFDRQELFEGSGSFRNVMHRTLRYYAFEPKTDVWYSPLSARYTEIPQPGTEGFRENEEATYAAMFDLYILIGQMVKSGDTNIKDDEGKQLILPLRFKDQDVDQRIMGILEDELLALLARLQYVVGYVINTNSRRAWGNRIAVLQDLSNRKYISRELSKYFDAFAMEDSDTVIFHRLPALRMRQAKAQGIVLPESPMKAVETHFKSVAAPSSTRFASLMKSKAKSKSKTKSKSKRSSTKTKSKRR